MAPENSRKPVLTATGPGREPEACGNGGSDPRIAQLQGRAASGE